MKQSIHISLKIVNKHAKNYDDALLILSRHVKDVPVAALVPMWLVDRAWHILDEEEFDNEV